MKNNVIQFPATYAERQKVQYRRMLREIQEADEIVQAAFGCRPPTKEDRPKYKAVVPKGWVVIEGMKGKTL